MERGDVIGVLNDLIETSKDGEEGFRTCADNVKNAVLRTFFLEKAARCREGAAQLQHIVRQMGGVPGRRGSMTGAAHRFWVDIRGTLSGMDEHAILTECERGEETAVRAYEDALNRPLPADVRRVVDRQYAEVKTNRDRVREMRNATA
jgi:uncharacterized protein (TIGR02284 family)